MSGFVDSPMYSAAQMADGAQLQGLTLALLLIFGIVVVAASYRFYEIGKKKGEKEANDKLQEHVLRSQIMKELGMSAGPQKPSLPIAGASPFVPSPQTDSAAKMASLPIGGALPVAPQPVVAQPTLGTLPPAVEPGFAAVPAAGLTEDELVMQMERQFGDA